MCICRPIAGCRSLDDAVLVRAFAQRPAFHFDGVRDVASGFDKGDAGFS